MRRKPIAERLWEKVDRSGGPDACWPFTARRNHLGYGRIHSHYRPNGVAVQAGAHRVAWEVTNGSIPDGIFVCHHCDNRSCCNPAHLFLGNQLENMRDASIKERLPGSSKRLTCKKGHPLTDDNVYVRPSTGSRRCLTCKRIAEAAWKQHNRERWNALNRESYHRLNTNTHCPQGHLYDDANTYWHRGKRSCLTCKREQARAHHSTNA